VEARQKLYTTKKVYDNVYADSRTSIAHPSMSNLKEHGIPIETDVPKEENQA
jgi:hypothetical protein